MRRLYLLLSVAGLAAAGSASAAQDATPPAGSSAPRNLIFLLGDGMGFAHVKAYRFYADNPRTEIIEPLPFDPHLVGAVATDSIVRECSRKGGKSECERDPYGVTDSASSATAYSTGRDTVIQRIGVDADGRRVKTILERARSAGKATGMVATVQVTHASPAAFAAHVGDRYETKGIANQLYDNQWQDRPMVEVLLGGGLSDLRRTDRDLVAKFADAGYQVVSDRTQLLAARGPLLLGLFAPEQLPASWDRPVTTPSLADMTRSALDILEDDADGFFLFVEGSQIDWAAHENNVVGVISEMEDFTAAITVALDHAAVRADTLVVVTADHETGGMSIGSDDVYRWDPRPMRGLEMTPAEMANGFIAGTGSLSAYLKPLLPFRLTREERQVLDGVVREPDAVFNAICALFDRRTVTGWTTHGHTAVDVPIYAIGPGSERFRGTLQNEEVGRRLQELLLPEG